MRFQGQVWRAHHPRWSFAPASGEGAALHGGRFNRKGLPTLYTSLLRETAWLEAQQGFPFKAQPMTLCCYEVDCEAVLDLRHKADCRAAGVDPDDLTCAWEDLASMGREPPSWRLADQLGASGYAGILAPSFAAGRSSRDFNAVFWRWSNDRPHQVKVIDDYGRLPHDDKSWR